MVGRALYELVDAAVILQALNFRKDKCKGSEKRRWYAGGMSQANIYQILTSDGSLTAR